LKIKKEIVSFKKNNERFIKFNSTLSAGNNYNEDEACCPWQFYACCTVCAGTIAAFPAYLACCALCFSQFCCNPTPKQ
jgi:hypothetical protein